MAEWVTSEGVHLHHPNRERGAAKTTRVIIVLLLLVSVVLMAIVTIGGWEKLQGAKAVQVGYILLYLVLAVQVARWSRGSLPLTAALAMGLLIFAAIAGPTWLARDKPGFASPSLDDAVLGVVTLILIPVQILLIGLAMSAFKQAWNVEEELPESRRDRLGDAPGGARPGPAAA
jgi:hypothetical protein